MRLLQYAHTNLCAVGSNTVEGGRVGRFGTNDVQGGINPSVVVENVASGLEI